jgi:hypothetical protein
MDALIDAGCGDLLLLLGYNGSDPCPHLSLAEDRALAALLLDTPAGAVLPPDFIVRVFEYERSRRRRRTLGAKDQEKLLAPTGGPTVLGRADLAVVGGREEGEALPAGQVAAASQTGVLAGPARFVTSSAPQRPERASPARERTAKGPVDPEIDERCVDVPLKTGEAVAGEGAQAHDVELRQDVGKLELLDVGLTVLVEDLEDEGQAEAEGAGEALLALRGLAVCRAAGAGAKEVAEDAHGGTEEEVEVPIAPVGVGVAEEAEEVGIPGARDDVMVVEDAMEGVAKAAFRVESEIGVARSGRGEGPDPQGSVAPRIPLGAPVREEEGEGGGEHATEAVAGHADPRAGALGEQLTKGREDARSFAGETGVGKQRFETGETEERPARDPRTG